MFATIAARYPRPTGDPAATLDDVLRDQLDAGLEMVGDGEVRAIERDADVVEAVAAWQRAARRARALSGAAGTPTAPPVKACIVGPLSTRDPRGPIGPRVREAVVALLEAGVPLVQLDEPWLGTPEAATDEGRALARTTWAALLDGVVGHVSLSIPGGGAVAAGPDTLTAAPFSSYLVDLVTGPDDWRSLARLPGDRGAILGVADLRRSTPDPPEVLLWAARYAASMRGRGLARVGLAPASGLERLPRDVARRKLAGLAAAVRLSRLPQDELLRRIDPRAIDARSAALGRWDPRPRRPRPS